MHVQNLRMQNLHAKQSRTHAFSALRRRF
jgi:hypothetical protein